MTKSRWDSLPVGTVLTSAASGHSFVITEGLFDNKGRHCGHVLVRSIRANSPNEWSVVSREQLKRKAKPCQG